MCTFSAGNLASARRSFSCIFSACRCLFAVTSSFFRPSPPPFRRTRGRRASESAIHSPQPPSVFVHSQGTVLLVGSVHVVSRSTIRPVLVPRSASGCAIQLPAVVRVIHLCSSPRGSRRSRRNDRCFAKPDAHSPVVRAAARTLRCSVHASPWMSSGDRSSASTTMSSRSGSGGEEPPAPRRTAAVTAAVAGARGRRRCARRVEGRRRRSEDRARARGLIIAAARAARSCSAPQRRRRHRAASSCSALQHRRRRMRCRTTPAQSARTSRPRRRRWR